VADVVAPVVPSAGALRPLGGGEVRLDGGFWGERQALNAGVILDHCLEWMTRLGWVENFRLAASGRLPEGRRGREFSDADVYKLLEALCWEAGRSGGASPELERTIGELSEAIAAAQEPDGYLNTRFGHQGAALRYTDLEWGHELYCYGHLIQAAVARLRSHGEDLLVRTARRAADHMCREFGADGRDGVCGHPEVEMALVELYRATGEQRYLEQARLFVERRGRPALGDIARGREYFQDDMPVRAARTFRGHAVRALYLASGAVDVAVETGDAELLEAVAEQWRHTIASRTYLTGGMGSRHAGEAFGDDFELPPDRAYAETCAGVASVMLAWRLLLATGDPRYADLAERTLYNVVAASPALDGHSFFYANPLHQRVPGAPPAPDVESSRAASSLRAPWFTVACCPPNVARTLASLAGYVATADAGGVQLQQLTGCTVRTTLADGRAVGLRVETGYPWDGAVTVRVQESGGGPWRLGLRVPWWAQGATLRWDGGGRPVGPGLAEVELDWRPGQELRLELPVRPRWTRPDPRIDAVRGCVAVERGPLVYCAESAGQDPAVQLDAIAVDASAPPAEEVGDGGPGSGDAVALACSGRTVTLPAPGWPYGEVADGSAAGVPLRLIPYHRWGNRGAATMRVWLPERT
jgi:uncharacterized protein